MKILSIDLGKKYGWAFDNGIKDFRDIEGGTDRYEELYDWYNVINVLLSKYNPDILVLSQTNNYGFWNATRKMLMQAGVAFACSGSANVAGVELNDTQARKAVFGKGIKKKEVQSLFPYIDADQLDAMVLARGWFLINQEPSL